MSHLADLALALGEIDESVKLGEALVSFLRVQRSRSTLCVALWNLIRALQAQGNSARAAVLMPEANGLAQDYGMPVQRG
jgi:hypothetical protein